MASASETADLLAGAYAKRGTPAPRRDPAATAPPADAEPRTGSPEDVGHVHAPARRGRPAPPTDRQYLESLPGVLVHVRDTGEPPFPWEVVVRRRAGRERGVYGKTEAEALRDARTVVERELDAYQGGPR